MRALGRGLLFCRFNDYIFRFNADGKDMIAFARSHEHLLEICDVVLRLLAASAVHTVILSNWGSPSVYLSILILGVFDGAVPQSEGVNARERRLQGRLE
jgi:hypothetical protein